MYRIRHLAWPTDSDLAEESVRETEGQSIQQRSDSSRGSWIAVPMVAETSK